MVENSSRSLDRRTLLGGIASGGVTSVAGCSFLERDEDGATTDVDVERAQVLAERFAPTLYFDRDEEWFPTDPRSYESDEDGTTVVNGFDALEGYVQRGGGDDPPEPRAFYHVVEYEESSLAVVQYWFYSVFDQFTANFHWHDWELLQVFVDTDTDEPQLYVASAHSRNVPNNEFLDPDSDRRPRLLVELGSHSSGLSINAEAERFQRFPLNGDIADITNSVIDGIEDVVAIPLAYGLPRDEGLALPYTVPELDGAPLYEHDRLPSVDASDLVTDALTVRSFEELQSPPTDLPKRETSEVFDFDDHETAETDLTYDLVPTSELEHIEAFTGPQLSFEFTIPEFAEDLISHHITTTGTPWKSPRYMDPAEDITERTHRQALADRYDAIADPSPINQVIAGVTNAVAADDAPEDEGLTTVSSSLESFALLQSEPQAVPTFQGVAVVRDVPDGEHTLSINGAGVTPHSETVTVSSDDGPTIAGVDGEIPVVARENAMKLEVDPREADSDLRDLAIEDDFAGRMYDAPLSEPDAVYVHRGGAFTTEVRDTDGEIGAHRVNPTDEKQVRIENPRTGTASLATYLADLAEETQAQVAAVADDDGADSDGSDEDVDDDSDDGQGNAVRGLAEALDAVATAARRAAENADTGNRRNANRELETVASRLDRVETRLADARDSLPDGVENANDNRLEQARRRTEQARAAAKL